MRRVLLLAVLLAAAPGGVRRPPAVHGRSRSGRHVDVGTPDLRRDQEADRRPRLPSRRSNGCAGGHAVGHAAVPGRWAPGRRGRAARPDDRELLGVLVRAVPQGDAGAARRTRGASRRCKVLGVDFLDTQPGAALDLAERSKVGLPAGGRPAGCARPRQPAAPHLRACRYTVVRRRRRQGRPRRGRVRCTTEADVAAAAQQYLGVGG